MAEQWIPGKLIAGMLMSLSMTAATASPIERPARFAIACTGAETVTAGRQMPKQLAYDITLSFDLPDKLYCYGACGKEQTYPIADPSSSPIRLANLETSSQMRRMTFDRGTMRLIDDQRIAMEPVTTLVRHATAVCKPALFQQPWQPVTDQPR